MYQSVETRKTHIKKHTGNTAVLRVSEK